LLLVYWADINVWPLLLLYFVLVKVTIRLY